MSNTFLTADQITKEAMKVLVNNMVFAKKMGRELNKEWSQDRKIGETVRVRKPAKYTVRTGKTFAPQDITEEYTSVSIDTMKGVDVQFDSSDLALKIQDFSDLFLKPAVSRLAHEIDYDCMSLFQDINSAAGAAGSTLTAETILTAKAILDENSAPLDPVRSLIVDPRTEIKAVDLLKGHFNPTKEIGEQYRSGSMGSALGFDWYMSQNVNRHVVGAHGGAPKVNGGSQTGTSLVTDGWTNSITGILKKGDVFTIDGVYKVNPANQRSTGQLQQFVVTADANSGASTGPATLSIYPAIVTSGAGATVTASPADNADIHVVGTASASTAANLAFHRDAFKLVFVELPQPKGMDMASTISVPEIGLSISFVRGFDISDRSFKSRLDVLYGKKTVRPEFACRLHL